MEFFSLARKEPYRLLFPLGALQLFYGLGCWAVYWLWPVTGYPAYAHIAIQAGPVMLSFMLGFLYTLLPKLFRIPPLSPIHLILLVFCLAGQFLGAALLFKTSAKILYLIALLQFAAYWLGHQKHFKAVVPPPLRFIQVAFVLNIPLTLGQILAEEGLIHAPPTLYAAARLYSLQGFLFSILLGGALFLLPGMFFSSHRLRDHLEAHNRFSQKKSWMYAVLALTLGASYFLEPLFPEGFHSLRMAAGLRLGVLLYLLWTAFKIQHWPRKQPALLIWAYVSLWCLPLAPLGILLWPRERVSWDHITYVNGFILLALTIGAKLLASHGGNTGLLKKYPGWMWTFGGLITLGMSTRVTAFFVKSYNMHLGVAALCVLISTALWLAIFLPMAGQPAGGSAQVEKN